MILIPVTINSAGNSNIGYLDTTNSSGFYEDVVVGTNYVYLAQDGVNDAGLVIISINDHGYPTIIGKGIRDSGDSVHCVSVNSAETVAVIGASSKLYIYNITNKSNPIRTDVITIGSTVYDVQIVGDLAYLAAFSTGLPVVNISDINNGTIIFNGKYPSYNDHWMQGLYVDTSRSIIYGAGGGDIIIFQINSSKLPDNPAYLSLTSGTTYSVSKIDDNKITIGDGNGNVYLINIQNPNSPSLISSSKVSDSIIYELVYSGNNFILLADYAYGLIVSNIGYGTPVIFKKMLPSYNGYGLAIKNNFVLIAGGSYGLYIYSYSDCVTNYSSINIPGFTLFYIILLILAVAPIVIYRNHKRKF